VKLVTFSRSEITHIGVLCSENGDQVIHDLNILDPSLPADLSTFLAQGEPALEKARRAQLMMNEAAIFPLQEVNLRAPIPRPGKILCVGLNYRDHIIESGLAVPEHPVIFAKYSNCIIGPNDPIVLPRVTRQVDWEGELGVVIGKRARFVSKQEALDYVAGYVVFNDVSARDYQFFTSQWTIGKTFDTFGPMGPALVTSDEIPDPAGLEIRTWVNDQVMQHSNTRHLVFDVPTLISYLSEVMTLDPGDLMITGTPAGVGFTRSPQLFLQPGDLVRVEIEKIGYIENPVISQA
jgi:acylpyruvate hydrolase